jgi:hypothetical protein
MSINPRVSGGLVVGLAVYETVALTTGKLPTVSTLCRRNRLVEAGLLAVLLTHLHWVVLADEAPAHGLGSPLLPRARPQPQVPGGQHPRPDAGVPAAAAQPMVGQPERYGQARVQPQQQRRVRQPLECPLHCVASHLQSSPP